MTLRPGVFARLAVLGIVALGSLPASAQRFGGADQPQQFSPARVFDVHHVALDVRVDIEQGAVAGSSTLTMTLLRPTAELLLHAADMTISRVVVGELSRPFEHRGQELVIELPGTLRAGRKLTVTIDYAASPRRGMYFIRPDDAYPDRPTQAWTQGEAIDHRHWFPSFDELGDRFSTEIRVTCRKPLVAVSNGRLVAQSEAEPGWHTFHWKQSQNHVNYLVTLVVGDLQRVELAAHQDRVSLPVYVHRRLLPHWRSAFQETAEMMAWMEELTGEPYPFDQYAQVVVTDFRWAGMENTGATTLTSRTVGDERAQLDWSSRGLVLHELAHQWFGNLITCRSWAHLWLNEGLATYLESMWIERKVGPVEAAADRMANLDWYLGEVSKRRVEEPRFEHPDDLFDGHTYAKGAWVLHMIRRRLGDDAFIAGLRLYTRRHRDSLVETNDLRRAFEDASGDSLGAFFAQWVHRTGHPQLKTRWRWDRRARVLRVTVEQTQGGVPFDVTLPIRVHAGGAVREWPVPIARRSETFTLPMDQAPRLVEIDPERDLLADLTVEKEEDELVEQARSGSTALSRIWAADQLGGVEGPKAQARALAVLARVAGGENEHVLVREMAISALGRLGGIQAQRLLLGFLEEKESRLRRAATAELGAYVHPDVRKALLQVWESDRSYKVVAAALSALGESHGTTALRLAMDGLSRESHREVVRRAAVAVLQDIGGEKAFRALLEHSRYARGHPTSSRAAAASALGMLGRDAALRVRAREQLVRLLADPRYVVRRAAVRALGTLGDPQVSDALKKLRERAVSREMEVTIDDTIAELRRDEQRGEVDALRTELETIRRRARDLERRIRNLEGR